MVAAEILFGFRALSDAVKLAKEAKDLTDSSAIKAKISSVYALLLEAQEAAINARTAHADQIDRIRELEAKLRDLEATQAELARYELQDLGWGAFAYMLKRDARGSEPPHWACTNCYKQGQISILQMMWPPKGRQEPTCPRCRTAISPKSDIIEWLD